MNQTPTPAARSSSHRHRPAVDAALRRWRARRRRQLGDEIAASGQHPANEVLLQPLDRRSPLQVLRPETTAATPPLVQRAPARAGVFATFGRLAVWLYAATLYFLTTLPDLVRSRQAATAHRALQLRRTLERMGGSFLKLGQQLSIRIDLLPLPYCQELSKLLDRVPAFPTDQAITIVERTLGAPLGTAFRSFDPEPIGSASLACVYQAELLDGQRVAVKVRRPGIAKQFAADFRALRWLLSLADFLTLAPPGLDSVVGDMRRMFEEELDFKKEARSTELFAERAQQANLVDVSAPQVFFDISSEEVLVTEFVSGFWLWEVLEAVEQADQQALALLAEQGIDPVLVARRLFRASLFGIFDNVLFHADPHPANVVVRPNSELVLIDFGACGSFSDNQVRLMRQFHSCQANEDTSGMVQCVLGLLEPLPPIDVDALAREIEAVLDDSTRAARSSNAEWWERTSAGVWISFLRVVRNYGVRVNLDVLRMVRSTLLYDTLAARLYPDLDIYGEYQRYRDRNARLARRRARRTLRQMLDRGVDDRFFLRLEETLGLSRRASYRLQRFLDSPTYRFGFLAGKAVFALSQTTRCALWLLAVLAIGVASLALSASLQEQQFDFVELTRQVLGHTAFQVTAALLVLVHVRRILGRFRDREV